MAKKRANGEGEIRMRSDGRWMSRITINGERVCFYGKSQGEVKEKLDDAKEQARKGLYIKPTKQTFGEWLDIWLNEYSKPVVRPTTYDSYEYLIRCHIKPGLGKILLKDIQPSQIQKFYNTKLTEKRMSRRKQKPADADSKKTNKKKPVKPENEKPLSSSTIRHLHIIIDEALDQALKEGKIVRNPAKATKPPKIEKKEARYLTPEQLTEFLGSITTDRWYPAFIVDLNSGMRLGELVALKWSNVDLQKGVVTVKEAVSRIKIGDKKWALYFHQPKSKKGLRAIPLPAGAVKELEKLKARQAAEKLLLGETYLGDGEKHDLKQQDWFVFTWEDGRLVDPCFLSKHFLKLIRQHNLSVNFHGLRHSYATALLTAGEHPKVVQELLGDSTISVVLDTYTHVVPGLKERAASKLDDIFSPKKAKAQEKI